MTGKMEFNRIEFLGIIAGSFAVVGGLEQLFKTWQTKSAEDISFPFLLGLFVSTSLWVIYHYLKKGGGPFVTTLIAWFGILVLTIMKVKYDRRDRLLRDQTKSKPVKLRATTLEPN